HRTRRPPRPSTAPSRPRSRTAARTHDPTPAGPANAAPAYPSEPHPNPSVFPFNTSRIEVLRRPIESAYYARLQVVDDLTAMRDEVLKIAVFVFGEAERLAATTFAPIARTHQVVVSGVNWIDIMHAEVDKGRAVRALQAALGVPPERTVVFADYLNDLEMLDAEAWSFAMANAHPAVRERARYLAPSNDEHGVVTVLRRLLGERPDADAS